MRAFDWDVCLRHLAVQAQFGETMLPMDRSWADVDIHRRMRAFDWDVRLRDLVARCGETMFPEDPPRVAAVSMYIVGASF